MSTSTPDRRASTFLLLCLGIVVPLVFAGTLVVCGLRLGHYNHLSRMVSELGAIGNATGQCPVPEAHLARLRF